MTELPVYGKIPTWTQADRLRKAREASGLEQAQLASDLGVSRNTVSNYEGGKVTPRRPVLVAWALRTGVPLTWLETGAESPRPAGPDGGSKLPRLDSNQQPFVYVSAQVTALPVRRLGRAA